MAAAAAGCEDIERLVHDGAASPGSREDCGRTPRRRCAAVRAAGIGFAALLLVCAAGCRLVGREAPLREQLRALVGLGEKWPPASPVGLDRAAETDIVLCGLDVGQAVYRLAAVGTSIRNSKYLCANQYDENRMAFCAEIINAVIYNTIFVANAVSQSISHCGHKVVAGAACSAAVTGMLANVDMVLGTSAALTQTCQLWWNSAPPPPNGITTPWQTTTTPLLPTLFPPTTTPNRYESDYQVAMTTCWFSVGQSGAFLARATIFLIDAALKCEPAAEGKTGQLGQRVCAMDVVGMAGSVGLMTRFLCLAINTCGGVVLAGSSASQARCAADIVGILAGVFGSVSPGIRLEDLCSPDALRPKTGRLLSEEEEAELAAFRDLVEASDAGGDRAWDAADALWDIAQSKMRGLNLTAGLA